MTTGTLYLKAEQHVEVVNPKVTVGDVVKLYSTDSQLAKDVSKLVLLHSKATEDKDYMVSILKIVELIAKEYPQVTIQNEGEADFIVTVKVKPKKSRLFEYLKVAFVAFGSFFGAAFSIMTFNEDSSVKEVFGYFCKMVGGTETSGRTVLELAYCVGLPLGIIVFYNHFAGFRLQRDPTPIQTQMRLYEEDVNKTMIQNASREGNTIDSN